MLIRQLSRRLLLSRRFFSTQTNDDLASSIAEFNKELDDIFGASPPTSLSGSSSSQYGYQDSHVSFPKMSETTCFVSFVSKELEDIFGASPPTSLSGLSSSQYGYQDSHVSSPKMSETTSGLTHIGGQGEAQMVDVSSKNNTKRTAIASCKVLLGKKIFDLVSANELAKGDVLSVAKIAGITGAKHTGNLIPLCHNISLSHVRVDLMLNRDDYSIQIEGEASTTGQTGVEMEAMNAVSIAGLTVYDMCKAASKDIQLTNVRLERKTGGKSGDWSRER